MASVELEADSQDVDLVQKGSVHEEFKEAKETKQIISTFSDIYDSQLKVELAMERLLVILDEYQEQPHLLDPHLESILNQLLMTIRDRSMPEAVLHLSFRVVYLLMKVRGSKYMVRLMPHEVSDFEPVLSLLERQSPQQHEIWESRYVLLFWLGVLSMIPFDLSRFDKDTAIQPKDVHGDQNFGVMHRVLRQAQLYLQVFDKSRDAAAFLTSKFLARIDVKQQRLEQFVDWALSTICEADKSSLADVQKIVGPLRALGLMFKHGKRQELLPYATRVMSVLNTAGLREANNTLLRHLITKLIQRVGLMYLPYRVAPWRYQRGSRSLAHNLGEAQVNTASGGTTGVQAITDEEYDVPEEMEAIIEELLCSLKDKDTIVRWSAAKGLGRTTGRLPQELADEVVGWLLEMFTIRESDGAWHGGCLALAELGRRGLLLPNRLADVVPVVLRALRYDERRGHQSVGSHVRDAACYVCWAFARAYEPKDLQPYVQQLASSLVMLTLFDREVNVRRAASAAFQENVGRQGTFPHGIDILTTCDYFSVSRIAHCYLELTLFVSQFSEYSVPVVDCLYQTKACHWDGAIRKLCCQALGKLTPTCPDHMINSVLPVLISQVTGIDLFTRHGAMLCVAEIVFALSHVARGKNQTIGQVLENQLVEDILLLPSKLHDMGAFKGVSGEFMRKGVCLLIERLSRAQLPVRNEALLLLWQRLMHDCLGHLDLEIRQEAAAAIPSFLSEYYKKGDQKAEVYLASLVENYVAQLQASTEPLRLGYALVLGQLPCDLLRRHFRLVLASLMRATVATSSKYKTWAEARAEAVTALARVVTQVGVADAARDAMPEVYDCLFVAMTDYTIDSRGDIGACVREASMSCLEQLTVELVCKAPELLTKPICQLVFCHLCQQAVEKIDRTRNVAAMSMYRLLYHEPKLPYIPHEAELKTIFKREECDLMNWAVEAKTFPLFVRLLSLPGLAYNVLLGLTVSVGGLTESLVRASWLSFWSYIQHVDSKTHRSVFDHLINIFKNNQKVDRVSIPMLKFLHKLLSNCVLESYSHLTDAESPLPQILALTKNEVARSKEPIKLIAGIDVLCGLLTGGSDLRLKALSQLLMFLCHPYPRIRKTAAQTLYEALLTYDDVLEEEQQEQVMTLLSDTQWDKEISVVRPIRNELCDLMEVPRPVIKKSVENK